MLSVYYTHCTMYNKHSMYCTHKWVGFMCIVVSANYENIIDTETLSLLSVFSGEDKVVDQNNNTCCDIGAWW